MDKGVSLSQTSTLDSSHRKCLVETINYVLTTKHKIVNIFSNQFSEAAYSRIPPNIRFYLSHLTNYRKLDFIENKLLTFLLSQRGSKYKVNEERYYKKLYFRSIVYYYQLKIEPIFEDEHKIFVLISESPKSNLDISMSLAQFLDKKRQEARKPFHILHTNCY